MPTHCRRCIWSDRIGPPLYVRAGSGAAGFESNRGAADRCPLGREGRDRAWVAAPRPRIEPEQLPGPTEPASCKDGPSRNDAAGSDRRANRCQGMLDVALRPAGSAGGLSSTRPGWSSWSRGCRRRAGAVLEATGGLELELVAALAAAACRRGGQSAPDARLRPRDRDAGRDALDAAVLAHFAEAVRPPQPLSDGPRPCASGTRRRQLGDAGRRGQRLTRAGAAVRPGHRGPHRLAGAAGRARGRVRRAAAESRLA